MSTLTDYNRAAASYDKHREAVGCQIMAGMIAQQCHKQLQDVHILDAGCGTGDYAKVLLDMGVGRVTLLDASDGMLDVARAKLAGYIDSGRVKEVVQATLPKTIPFDDDTFDAVLLCTVLHHFDRTDDLSQTYPVATQSMQELSRVMKPEGLLVITTVLPDVFENHCWWAQLCPSLTKRYMKLLPSVDSINKMANSAGLHDIQAINLLGATVFPMHNYDCVLDKSWRDALGYWRFATPDEVEMATEKARRLEAFGKLEEWGREHDHVNTTGIMTAIFFSKGEA